MSESSLEYFISLNAFITRLYPATDCRDVMFRYTMWREKKRPCTFVGTLAHRGKVVNRPVCRPFKPPLQWPGWSHQGSHTSLIRNSITRRRTRGTARHLTIYVCTRRCTKCAKVEPYRIEGTFKVPSIPYSPRPAILASGIFLIFVPSDTPRKRAQPSRNCLLKAAHPNTLLTRAFFCSGPVAERARLCRRVVVSRLL
jgi:hypothetical protein